MARNGPPGRAPDDGAAGPGTPSAAPPGPGGVRPFPRYRIRRRVLAAAAVAAMVAAAGAGLQGELGVRRASRDGPGPVSGAWFCPHGGAEGWDGWVAMANPGSAPVRVRLTTFGPRGVMARRSLTLPASTQVYRPVPAKLPGASTEVEYFGGFVGAGWVVQDPGKASSFAGSRCAPAPARSWYLPEVPTGRGQQAYVVVMNPFAQDATFDVVIRTDRRAAVTPGPLTPFVLPAGTSTALRLNQYLLQGPNERIVTAELHLGLGRAVAAAVNVSGDGLSAELGMAGLSRRWILPAAGFVGGTTLDLLNAQGHRADVSVIAQGTSFQRVVSGVDGLSLGPDQVQAYAVQEGAATGLVAEVTNHADVAVQRLVAGSAGDPALIGGAVSGRARWLLLPTLPPKGGRAVLVLQNASRKTARVRLELLGAGPPRGLPPLSIAPGRTVTVDLTRVAGEPPVSALLVASGGTIVVGGASYASNGGYAGTLAVPMRFEP